MKLHIFVHEPSESRSWGAGEQEEAAGVVRFVKRLKIGEVKVDVELENLEDEL